MTAKSRYRAFQMRMRLTREARGTRIDATVELIPVFLGRALIAAVGGAFMFCVLASPQASQVPFGIGFVPWILVGSAPMLAACFLVRYMTGQPAFLVASMQGILEAMPSTAPTSQSDVSP